MRAAGRTPGRELTVSALACAVGAALMLFAAGRTWASAAVTLPPPLPGQQVTLTGGDLAPAVSGLGIAGLAALAGLVATRGMARLVVGALLVLIGGGAAFVSAGATGSAHVSAEITAQVTAATSGTATHVATTAWWVAALLGGVILVLAGLVTVVRGRHWPGMSSRYEAPGARRRRPAGGGAGSMWDSLDQGTDPTVDAPAADDTASDDTASDRPAPDGAPHDERGASWAGG